MTPNMYWWANARYALVSSDEAHAIFSVILFPSPKDSPPEFMQHRWVLKISGVSGRGEIRVGQRWEPIRPHAELLIPANVPYAFRNLEPDPAHFYLTATPGGFEEYLETVAMKMPPGTTMPFPVSPRVPELEEYLSILGPDRPATAQYPRSSKTEESPTNIVDPRTDPFRS